MNYVEWVERVFAVLASAAAKGEGFAGGGEVWVAGLAGELGAEGDRAEDAAWQALSDLQLLGWVERPDNLSVRLTQLGRQVAAMGIRGSWPEIAAMWLEPEQEQFLEKAVELGEHRSDTVAWIELVDSADVFESLGWEDPQGRAYGLTVPLEQGRFVAERLATNAYVKVRLTYLGVVRATEAEGAEGQRLLEEVLREGETANVEVKQRLDLDTEVGKAKFIRHSLALATTKVSGRRFLVVGYDDGTLTFAEAPDPKVTQERIEQILHAYTDPTPPVRFQRVRVRDGEAILLEFQRDSKNIPYRVSKEIGPLKPGDVFVRHGSASEAPTGRELKDLEAEGLSASRE